jgi:hypothetical protein
MTMVLAPTRRARAEAPIEVTDETTEVPVEVTIEPAEEES